MKSGGNLGLAVDWVREHFRARVKINQYNEEISELLASQSLPSLRMIFMRIQQPRGHCKFMERRLPPCSNYPLPLNVTGLGASLVVV